MNLERLEHMAEVMLPIAAQIGGVILAGLLLSWIARRMVVWVTRRTGLDALGERLGVSKFLYTIGARRGLDYVLGQLVWYAGLLLTAAVTADLLGLDAVAKGVEGVVAYVPRVAAAGAVLLGGSALANLLRRLVEGFGRRRDDVEHPQALGNVAYFGTIVVSIVVAAGQAGLQTQLVESLLTTLVSIGAAAIGLAFALGGRESFTHLVAGHFLRRLARPGDRITVAEVEGVVVRYFGVCVVLKTNDGECTLPCAVVLREHLELERLGAKARARTSHDGE